MSEFNDETPIEQIELVELLNLSRSQNRVLVQQNLLLRQQVTTLSRSHDEYKSRVESLESQVDDSKCNVRLLQNDILTNLDVHRSLVEENDSLREKYDKEVDSSHQLVSEIEILKNRVITLETTLKDLRNKTDYERSEFMKENERLLNQNRQLQTERISIESRMCGLQSESFELNAIIDSSRATQETLEKKITDLEIALQTKEENIQRMRGRVAAAESSLSLFEQEKRDREHTEQDFRKHIQNLEKNFKDKQEDIERKASELRTITTAQLSSDRDRLSKALLNAQSEIGRLTTEVEAARKVKERAEAEALRMRELSVQLTNKTNLKETEMQNSTTALSLKCQELQMIISSLKDEMDSLKRNANTELNDLKSALNRERSANETINRDLMNTKTQFAKADTERKMFQETIQKLEISFSNEKTGLQTEFNAISAGLKEEVKILERKYTTIKTRSKRQDTVSAELLLAQQSLRRSLESQFESSVKEYENIIEDLRRQLSDMQKKMLWMTRSLLVPASDEERLKHQTNLNSHNDELHHNAKLDNLLIMNERIDTATHHHHLQPHQLVS
eukprot:GDKJ01019571.1.p1 GENE.GDKJ01019571.1~~GDKJ01019571.1.p1  ORF type:complete len:563 (+),score=106.97 GDKJ01019571.1:43-1731(+)